MLTRIKCLKIPVKLSKHQFTNIKGKWLDTFALTIPSISYYTSLEFIASYERGHAMKRVARGLQNGAQIMDLFGGSRKKKIFLFLPSSGM